MADEGFRCKRGWMVEPQGDGTVLPFFMLVRYNDVIATPESIYPDEVLEALASYRMTMRVPAELSTSINGWEVRLHDDHTYEADIRVPIVASEGSGSVEVGQKVKNNNLGSVSGLQAFVTLPFQTLNTGNRNVVTATVSGPSLALARSNIVTVPGTKTGAAGGYTPVAGVLGTSVTELFIQLTSETAFPANILTSDLMKQCAIHIHMIGALDPSVTTEMVIPEIAIAEDYSSTLAFS